MLRSIVPNVNKGLVDLFKHDSLQMTADVCDKFHNKLYVNGNS